MGEDCSEPRFTPAPIASTPAAYVEEINTYPVSIPPRIAYNVIAAITTTSLTRSASQGPMLSFPTFPLIDVRAEGEQADWADHSSPYLEAEKGPGVQALNTRAFVRLSYGSRQGMRVT
jgi:hypothetical protein